MKINNLSFPYPVLGIGDDIAPRPGFASEPKVSKSATSYTFEADLDMRNHDIYELVKSGDAKYVCEVECSRTLLRKCYFSNTPHFKIELSRKAIAERITFQFSIVVMRSIEGYENKDFHEDYVGYKFDLEPGDLLAFIGQFSYDIDIKYDKLKSVGSFMQITEGRMEKRPRFVLSGDKIDIKLPPTLYEQYRSSIKGNTQFAHIIHSSIVFNALVTGLLYYEDNKQTLWARTLKYRIDHESQLEPYRETLETQDPQEVMELAQDLLLDPYKRLFESLTNLTDFMEDDESC
jgi:hypothetical protein